MNKKFITLSLASFILTGLFLASNTVRADAPTSLLAAGPLTGWAWSDNIGWISLNCSHRRRQCKQYLRNIELRRHPGQHR